MIVSFSVPGSPVGKNACYLPLKKTALGQTGRRYNLILSQAGRDYKLKVRLYALRALRASDWPQDCYLPKRVRLTTQQYGTRHDAGASFNLIKDALEGVYFYNDRCVSNGPEDPSIRDGSAPRVEITVELLEARTQAEANALKADIEKRKINAKKRKLAKQKAIPKKGMF